MADQKNITVPDIGGASGVDVIEILVNVGDEIAIDTPLVTLESDKASMEIPSPAAGIIRSLHVKLGDKISQGDLLLTVDANNQELSDITTKIIDESTMDLKEQSVHQNIPVQHLSIPDQPSVEQSSELSDKIGSSEFIAAGPAVRRLAREFGINLHEVIGTGRKSRISKEDVQQYVKSRLQQPNHSGIALPTAATIDFSLFGNIDIKPLTKIKKITGINVHRSWVTIPHVTQFDEADITELEQFRKEQLTAGRDSSIKLTILAFVCKVVSKALLEYPQFNTSLDASGENLIYKHYVNIGVAVETSNGLVVPVIKNVNNLSINDIAKEMARLSSKAREKGLMPNDMNGGSMTISSLGGIGGTAFTPIVNSPEVAILGLSRSAIKPIYDNGEFKPRLILPLSLSYDHRVIDGAEAARFTRYIAEHLCDIRRLLL
ncbi:MAG: dihydrolipoyllysine-residue acetyltransferase [Legionella sp.]